MTLNRSVSILICTRDRTCCLLETLDSIARCVMPSDISVELIVIDNGSKDRRAIEESVSRFENPSVRCLYLHEPRIGKGYAYNRGIEVASGDVYLLTDDDVAVPTNWILEMCEPIWAGQADVLAGGVCFGRHLERDWQTPKSRSFLSSTELLAQDNPEWVVAANLSFSRRVLAKVPAFDTELGPGALGFEDETLFAWQAREAHFKISGNLTCYVQHNFSATRLCRSSLIIYFRKHGHSKAYVAYHWEHTHCRFTHLKLFKARCRWLLFRLLRPSQWLRTQGITDKEIDLVHAVGFYEQYIVERIRSCNYRKRGLTKLH